MVTDAQNVDGRRHARTGGRGDLPCARGVAVDIRVVVGVGRRAERREGLRRVSRGGVPGGEAQRFDGVVGGGSA